MQANWHYDNKQIKSVCCHLIVKPDDIYDCVFTGNSENFMLLCGECLSKPQKDTENALLNPSNIVRRPKAIFYKASKTIVLADDRGLSPWDVNG